MANKLDIIEVVTEFKHLQIREIMDDGSYFRRFLKPDMTLAENEHQEVKDKAEELWTDEVKSAWATHQAEQKAQIDKE